MQFPAQGRLKGMARDHALARLMAIQTVTFLVLTIQIDCRVPELFGANVGVRTTRLQCRFAQGQVGEHLLSYSVFWFMTQDVGRSGDQVAHLTHA